MTTIAGIQIPDSMMAREATQLVRDTETELLYHHSRRVFLFGSLAGKRKQLKYDPELLYIGAMFHEWGWLRDIAANMNPSKWTARTRRAISYSARYWRGRYRSGVEFDRAAHYARHSANMKPVVALVTAGVEMDVLGLAYDEFSDITS